MIGSFVSDLWAERERWRGGFIARMPVSLETKDDRKMKLAQYKTNN
ncbi:hypothetical protein [Variovorax sp. IB41]|nr:hypothetical protein [Variovorax sp. IB41]